ncbi:TIGR00304 family membrane protein [Archaeoglobus sulfaticallidus]|nr:DUF131 domain-containing protein [Archaeoglobus sulfaticallidus]
MDYIIFGFGLIMIGLAMLSLSTHANVGGIILIGPIPIVFGSSPESASLALILGLFFFVMMFALMRR